MTKVSWGIIIVSVLACTWMWWDASQYPAVEDLVRSDGIIHHPKYGSYPEELEFNQGMTIMPGQSAMVTIEIPVPRGLLHGICLRDGGSPEVCAKYDNR